MKTLAESLGINVAWEAASAPPVLEDLSVKEFTDRVVNSAEFREYIVAGLRLGTIPSAVLCRILDHKWGQPVKRVEVADMTHDLSHLSPEQLKARAQHLYMLAEELESVQEQPVSRDVAPSVH